MPTIKKKHYVNRRKKWTFIFSNFCKVTILLIHSQNTLTTIPSSFIVSSTCRNITLNCDHIYRQSQTDRNTDTHLFLESSVVGALMTRWERRVKNFSLSSGSLSGWRQRCKMGDMSSRSSPTTEPALRKASVKECHVWMNGATSLFLALCSTLANKANCP
jgi:hypothetical protein